MLLERITVLRYGASMYVGKVSRKEAKRRNALWYARDRADGVFQYFATEAEAEVFKEDYNSNKRRRAHNIPPTNKELKKWTAGQLVLSYMHGDKQGTRTTKAIPDCRARVGSRGL